MTFTELSIPGLWLIDCDFFHDERGFFARTWIAEEFRSRGLSDEIAQSAITFNRRRGTIRGVHYQRPPASQAKVVRVIRGAIFDVAVDLRPNSPTFGRWEGIELSADNRRALYIPAQFGHGYQTLTDDAELLYFMSESYSPADERGIRWNDPAFDITWPILPPALMNQRDAAFPDFVKA